MSASPAMAASSAMARVLPGRTTRGRVGGVGLRGESYASDSGNDAPRFEKHGTRGHGFSSSVPAFGASPTRPRPRSRRARVIRTAATSSSGDKNGGWLRPLEGLAQRMGVTIYQAPVPPAVVPGSRADFLEAMLQWHLQNSTSVDLVMREVSESILSEIQSFPVDKVAIGESPSVAMHVPIPLLRANPNGPPASLSAMGARSMKQSKGAGTAPNESTLTQKEKGSPYDTGADDQGGPLQSFPSWDGWTQPTTALTLRAVLMTAGALSAAAGMRPAGGRDGTSKGLDKETDPYAPQILLPLNLEVVDLGDETYDVFGEDKGSVGDVSRKKQPASAGASAERLRLFFNTLWPGSPYTFGTYDRQQINSDVRYLSPSPDTNSSLDGFKKKRGDKRLVVIVNVSSPGDENRAESDGEGMVNAAETLLELNVPFVVLTLWMDDSLGRSVKSGKPARAEKEALRVRMEKRTRILLGRSVKRKEARENVRLAFAAAKKAPQGAGYVALEEALAEARAVGADTSTSYGTGGPKGFQGGSEAEAMLSEIRAKARAAEASALAAALTSNCLQVPVDIKGLEANLKRARGVIAKTERDAAAVDASRSVDAIQRNIKDEATAKAVREWNESAAVASDILSSADASASALDTDDSTTVTREVVMLAGDVDRFASGVGDDVTAMTKNNLTTLREAVRAAEAALDAVALEGDLRTALADDTSLEVSAVPKLEALMVRAAKVAERKPPLTQEGAAKLNALTSRCFSRATALQEMEEAKAGLAKALEPSLRGEDLLLTKSTTMNESFASTSSGLDHKTSVPALERAIARAKASAWPWQLADAVVGADKVLERWRAIGRVRDALDGRDMLKIKREIAYAKKAHPEVETAGVEKLLAELEAEDALEGGDRRLKAYFAASKMAWAGGSPTSESAEMLRTIRDSLAVTDAEHDQVTKAVSAGSRTAAETNRAEMLGDTERSAARMDTGAAADKAPTSSSGKSAERVSFSASGTGTRGALFEGSEAIYLDDELLNGNGTDSEFTNATELYVLSWDDSEIELYVGGAGPRLGGFLSNSHEVSVNTQIGFKDEASLAWASAVSDDPRVGGDGDGESDEASSGSKKVSAWRRVGADIIYNEEEVIGVGSSGTYVFRGYVQHTTRAQHSVAVKRIQRPPGEEGRELLKLVEREVELLTALNQSPKVPFFHRWAATSSHVFIALELCAESLREHVTRLGDSMPVQRRFDILKETASGIAWLHDPQKPGGRIAHNDLKPENLLVDAGGCVKIADVGLGVQLSKKDGKKMKDGKIVGGQKNSTEYTMSTFRKYGIEVVLAGRAPEMLTNKPLTPAADVWAMGVVFYFVFTGRASPFSETGRDVPTDAAIINGRHHLNNIMTVPGLSTRRALEGRHLLASMLSPDPTNRPTARAVQKHPLFWSDDAFLTQLVNLHQRSASFDKDVGRVLSDLSDDALLNAVAGGNTERGALLAAASMDLTDWKRLVDAKLLKRITGAHVTTAKNMKSMKSTSTNASTASAADVGRKPYGDGFGDLLRFCRNASEHPPSFEEVEPLLKTLTNASKDLERDASQKADLAAAKKSRRLARKQIREGGAAGRDDSLASRDENGQNPAVSVDSDSLSGAARATVPSVNSYPGTALLPPGIDPRVSVKKLTREERKSVLAAYLAFMFPGMPLAVFEVRSAIEQTAAEQRDRRNSKGGAYGKKGAGAGKAAAATAKSREP